VRGRKAQGLKYEKKVLDYLEDESSFPLLRSPWLEFEEASGRRRWCQPDGLLLDIWGGRIIVVEVKYQHTSNAWWQLRQLYLPVLRRLFGEYVLHPLEICKWYDPAQPFPEPVSLLPDPAKPNGLTFGVHIWKP
jgi:hypothetical protein